MWTPRRETLVRFICVLCFTASPVFAETWVKAVTPHFTVISNGNEKDARTVAADFERIRATLASSNPALRIDGSAQTIIVAPNGASTFDKLLPADKKQDTLIAGLFFQGSERNYVIVRLDFLGQAERITYHEYVHNVLRLNFTRIPTWLDEGLSDFYANTRFEGDKVYIGAPSPDYLRLLQSRDPFPLNMILTPNWRSSDHGGADAVRMFYAESWALTHYLTFGEGMGNGQRLNAYLGMLQKKVDTMQAFQQTFGDISHLQHGFSQYISKSRFNVVEMNNPPKIDPASFQAAPMTVAETDAQMGGFFNYMGSPETAEKWLTAALAADPKSALAHENMAFYAFRKGDDDTARKEFDQAVALAPDAYLAVYYQAMMKYGAKTDEGSLTGLGSAMTRVLQLNPAFAPALIIRSDVLVKQHHLQAAYNDAAQAWRLEPDRGGYLTHLGAILYIAHDFQHAIEAADAVVSRWSFTEGSEAIAVADHARTLGKIAETPEEKAAEAEEMKYADGFMTAQGTVSSVTCESSKAVQIVLSTLPTGEIHFEIGAGFNVGINDTLWYGEDHFARCYHLEGLPAVVRYTKTSDPNPKYILKWLELRDDLTPIVPTPPLSAAN